MQYTAKFSNGLILNRQSQREYSHAWMIVWLIGADRYKKTGFARTLELAKKAVINERPVKFDPKTNKWGTNEAAKIILTEIQPAEKN